MNHFIFKLTFLLIASISLISFWWRLAAMRRSLPCPAWLGWLLENPYMEAVASAATILNQLDLEAGMSVLDIGCGPGRLTIPAARRVGSTGTVVALDIQPAMLQKLEQRLQENQISNVQTILGGIGQNLLSPSSFDRAILVTVLGEIPEQSQALQEIYDALKPNGLLSVTEVIPDPHYQSQKRVRRLAEGVGFGLTQTYGNALAFTMHFRKAG